MQIRFRSDGVKIPIIVAPQTPSWRVADVAKYFGVKPTTVYHWVYRGLLTVHKTPGGRLRFVESEVKAAIQKGGLNDGRRN